MPAGLEVCAALSPCCLALARQLGLSEAQQDSTDVPNLTCFSGKRVVEGDVGWSACFAPPAKYKP